MQARRCRCSTISSANADARRRGLLSGRVDRWSVVPNIFRHRRANRCCPCTQRTLHCSVRSAAKKSPSRRARYSHTHLARGSRCPPRHDLCPVLLRGGPGKFPEQPRSLIRSGKCPSPDFAPQGLDPQTPMQPNEAAHRFVNKISGRFRTASSVVAPPGRLARLCALLGPQLRLELRARHYSAVSGAGTASGRCIAIISWIAVLRSGLVR